MSAFLEKGLTEAGYEVEIARDGVAGLELALAKKFDLLLIDVMVPKKDGWTVVEEVRAAGVKTPILFLTARDSVPDRVKGLELGGDDYLVKPFAFAELLARVRSLLRRPAAASEHLQIDDLELDLRRTQPHRGRGPLHLTRTAFLPPAHPVPPPGPCAPRP